MQNDVVEQIVCHLKPDDQANSFVRVVDVMPRLTDGFSCDYAIVQAARVSTGQGTKTPTEDRGLIRYLLRHCHTTPFEMCEIKWHMAMPIATARQWIRHRTANVNEYSARYTKMKDLYYIPAEENIRKQSKMNKQGGDVQIDSGDAQWFMNELEESAKAQYEVYDVALAKGISREQARYLLPVNFNTEWYWKNDLWNTMNFLRLRMDSHAQQEIRTMACLMHKILGQIFPLAMEAFDDYIDMNNTIKLSKIEVARIQKREIDVPFENKREEEEFQAKLERLDLKPLLGKV